MIDKNILGQVLQLHFLDIQVPFPVIILHSGCIGKMYYFLGILLINLKFFHTLATNCITGNPFCTCWGFFFLAAKLLMVFVKTSEKSDKIGNLSCVLKELWYAAWWYFWSMCYCLLDDVLQPQTIKRKSGLRLLRTA